MEISVEKKNLFVLLSRIPYPLEKGDKLRAYHQLKILSKTYNLFIFALYEGEYTAESEAKVSELCVDYKFFKLTLWNRFWGMLYAIFSGLPFQTAYFFSFKAKKMILQSIQKFKPYVAYVQLIRVANYLEDIQMPKILDFQDALSTNMFRRSKREKVFLRAFFKFESKLIKKYELRLLSKFNHCTIISELDRITIEESGNQQISIVPNGVDTQFFSPQNLDKKYDISFVGNMGYAPNVDASIFLVKEIMPLVWKILPKTKVVLAGANPTPEVLHLQSSQVEVTGWVDDIRNYYAESHVFVAPLRMGTGMQNKILEAMAMGLPCVSTSLAANPIGANEKEEIMVENSAADIANQIVFLLNNPDKCSVIAQNTRRFVEKQYSWESQTETLLNLIEKNI